MTETNTNEGLLVVVEGIDGTGKSSVARALAETLGATLVIEPSPDGEIRRLITSGAPLSPDDEVRLFREDRAAQAERVTRPALARGETVVQDRSYVSSVAYQGAREGLGPEAVLEANRAAAPEPDLILLLDLGLDEALARVEARGEKVARFEERDYLARVAKNFADLERLGVRRVIRIDARPSLEEVVGRCGEAVAAARVEGRERAALRARLAAVVKRGEFTLTSGRKSDFYIDGRLVTLTAEGSRLSGRLVAAAARRFGATAVGGLALAACPIITATGVVSAGDADPIGVFYIRKEAKKHGTGKRIEGPPLRASDRVLIVDDTATSGGSLVAAAEAVAEETEAKVVGAVVLVDRLEGARERLNEAEIPFEALFTRDEL